MGGGDSRALREVSVQEAAIESSTPVAQAHEGRTMRRFMLDTDGWTCSMSSRSYSAGSTKKE